MQGETPRLAGDASDMAELTVTGERLRRLCEQENARLLVLDPLAAAYAADENARGLVRAFVSHWDAWGQANDCAVLILAHPPKSAGMSYAGSTDWQGAARALWTLQAEISKSSEDGPRTWKLEFINGNYGPRPEPLLAATHGPGRALPTGKSPDFDSAFVEGAHAGLLP